MTKSLKKLLWLGAFIYALQALERLPSASLFFYFKETLHLRESQQQYIGGLVSFVWWIKILIGYFTDNYLNKKQWIVLSVFGSVSACILCGLVPFSLPIIIGLLILANMNTAIRDVAIDGLSCVAGKENANCETFQKFQWGAITVVGILVSLLSGYIAQYCHYSVAFWILVPFYVGLLVYLYCCADDTPNTTIKAQRSLVLLWNNLKEILTNKRFLLVCGFLFLFKYSPDFTTQLNYIERDVFGWSRFFMTGIMPAVCGGVSLLGIYFFDKYYKKSEITRWLIISVWVSSITMLGYLYFTPVTSILYSVVYSVISMFVHLIVMTWMAESTLKGKESMSYALLASVSNFSGSVSGLSGGWLYDSLRNLFSNKVALNTMIIIAALASFLCFPFISKIFKDNHNHLDK